MIPSPCSLLDGKPLPASALDDDVPAAAADLTSSEKRAHILPSTSRAAPAAPERPVLHFFSDPSAADAPEMDSPDLGSDYGLEMPLHLSELPASPGPGLGFPPHVDSHRGRTSEPRPAPGPWEGMLGCDEGQGSLAPVAVGAAGASRLVEPGTGCAHKECWRRLRARKANPCVAFVCACVARFYIFGGTAS